MNNDRDRSSQEEKKAKIEDALVHSSVVTIYNKKTYRIERIDWGRCPDESFEVGKEDNKR